MEERVSLVLEDQDILRHHRLGIRIPFLHHDFRSTQSLPFVHVVAEAIHHLGPSHRLSQPLSNDQLLVLPKSLVQVLSRLEVQAVDFSIRLQL